MPDCPCPPRLISGSDMLLMLHAPNLLPKRSHASSSCLRQLLRCQCCLSSDSFLQLPDFPWVIRSVRSHGQPAVQILVGHFGLAARPTAGCDSRSCPGRSAVAKRHLLVGIRLLMGHWRTHRITFHQCRADTSHRRTVPSSLPDATVRPSGLQLSAPTALVWPEYSAS